MRDERLTSDGVILGGGHKIFRTALLLIAVAFSACSFYDNYDIDLMQGATASVESSSETSQSSSSVGKNSGTESGKSSGTESGKSSVSKSSSSVTDDSKSSSSRENDDKISSSIETEQKSSSSTVSVSSSSALNNDEDKSSSSSKEVEQVVSSSSAVAPVSSSEEPKQSSSSAAPAFKCGEKFKDPRDGKEYTTVAIPNKSGQCWFAENLNYAVEKSACYGDDSTNCEKYGRLYRWAEAQSACPEGSKLPEQADWEQLDTYLGNAVAAGKYLKAEGSWDNAEDIYGFAALPAGYYSSDDEEFIQDGSIAIFWSATESGTDAYARVLKNITNNVDEREYPKTNMNSIRCLVQ